jgi:membrane-associated phospholipid phosphatase
VQNLIQEHMDARIASGANVRSDLEAGYALGRSIAIKFANRARTDRAGASAGTPAIWKQMESATIARGEIPWLSLEFPARPAMLPLFGKVQPWLFDSAILISIRPPAPPSTSSEKFKKELEEVYQFSKNPTREQIRVAQFWADGVGTYTPPGHWNAIAADAFVPMQMSEVRWARNLALLNMALMDASIACWDTKYLYFNPRPGQMDKRIKTVVGVPNFPSYTSGHSTFSGAAATVLSHIVSDKTDDFMQMANEASLSRIYGAIHYRSDCDEGLACGMRVGSFAVKRAAADGAGN